MWLRTAAAGVREAPRHEIAGWVEVYGDLTGATVMVVAGSGAFGDGRARCGRGWGAVARLAELSRAGLSGRLGR